jgi:hypothetical protein
VGGSRMAVPGKTTRRLRVISFRLLASTFLPYRLIAETAGAHAAFRLEAGPLGTHFNLFDPLGSV